MSKLIDRVKIFAATSGTGPFALGPNVPGFRGSEVLTDGETYSYAVEQSGEFEAGTAEYVLSTNTLVRNPLISSNGNAAVAFQANAQIAFTALARDYAAQSADTLRADLAAPGGANLIGTGAGITVDASLAAKQATLVSGTNIKTVGGTSLVGPGNVGTTVGGNLLSLTNPSAITFPRFNADNTVTALNALDFRTAIGAAGGGSVTSVAALTLGTTGTDLSSSVANGTSTPVITLNVPTVSASARGVVTPALFNAWQAKQDPLVSGTTIKTVGGTSLLGSGNVGTTVGGNLLSLTNPSAITFPRFNADNTVTALSAAATVTALGGTTVGANLFGLANPSDVTFPRFNADNTVSALTPLQTVAALGAVDLTSTQTVTGVKTFTTPTLAGTASGTAAGRLGYSSGALTYGNGSVQRTVVNTAEAQTLDAKTMTNLVVGSASFAPTGSAPIGGLRAFISFNGQGTPAVLASLNISSITDNGVGDYTLNFTTAMPDAFYIAAGMGTDTNAGGDAFTGRPFGAIKTTTAFQFKVFDGSINPFDSSEVMLMIAR